MKEIHAYLAHVDGELVILAQIDGQCQIHTFDRPKDAIEFWEKLKGPMDAGRKARILSALAAKKDGACVN